MFEIYFQVQSSNGSITEDHALRKWSRRYIQSLSQSNLPEGRKNPRVPMSLENMLREAGFVDVRREMKEMHLSDWDMTGKSC